MNYTLSKYHFWFARFSYIIIFLLCSSKLYSQGEANNWYFGNGAGLTFNGKTALAVTDGNLKTVEGCATISDKNGNLLFYTDGVNVWDKTHNITPNGKGLLGSWNSTQSAIIVPRPASSNQFYIFTTDAQAKNNGLQFSVFDLSLNSGKGDIVSTQKNIKLVSPICEKLTAIEHSNKKDIWVLIHKYLSDTIFAYLITSAGVNTVPVKNTTGLKLKDGIAGYMKVSPDGSKIAYVNYTDSSAIGDFDTKTGRVSNMWSFMVDGAYGTEFSATSNYLYVSVFNKILIYQFDALVKKKSSFIASRVTVDSINKNVNFGALQLGPDKKIYCSNNGSGYLDVINAPDSFGKACRMQHDYINLQGKSCFIGLPNFIQSYLNRDILLNGNCFGDTTWFSINDRTNIDSIKWVLGDIKSGINNTANGFKVFHLFTDTGTFKVRSILFKGTFSDTIFLDVNQKSPNFTLGKDTIVCEKQKITIGDFKGSFGKYLWNDKSINATLVVDTSGFYTLRVEDKYGCYKLDTIKVSFLKLPIVNIGNDTTICLGDSVKLTCNVGIGNKLKWNTGDTSNKIMIRKKGIYSIQVNSHCGIVKYDTIVIKVGPEYKVYIGSDTAFCGKFSYLLKANPGFMKYKWNMGDTTMQVTVNSKGIYSVKVIDSTSCPSADTIAIDEIANPIIKLSYDSITCKYAYLSIDSLKGLTYLWNTGETNTSIKTSKDGLYTVTASHKFCNNSDSIFVKIPSFICEEITYFIPNAFSPNGDKDNDVFKVFGTNIDNVEIIIFDSWGEKLIETTGKDPYWDGTFKNAPCQQSAYFYMIKLKGKKLGSTKYIKGTVTLLR
jgi:gliding motility-associated-like protein